MNCLSDEVLSSFNDQVLDPAEQQLVLEHLQECWQCRRTAGDFRALSTKLQELPDLDVPNHFHQDLMLKLGTTKQRRFPSRWTSIAASVVLMLSLAISGYNLLGKINGRNSTAQELALSNLGAQAKSIAAPQAAGAAATDSAEARQDATSNMTVSGGGTSEMKGINPGYIPAEKSISLELQVNDVDAAAQTVLKQVLNIPEGEVVSKTTLSPEKVQLQLEIPGPATQKFLSELSAVGVVIQGNFTGNIAETSGSYTMMMLISKKQ